MKQASNSTETLVDISAVMHNPTDTGSKAQPYPKFVICIIVHEFFERYAYYGARSILMMFLVSQNFDSTESVPTRVKFTEKL